MTRLLSQLSMVLAGFLVSCATTSSTSLDLVTGDEVTVEDTALRFSTLDVVFMGEEHDNDVGHAMQMDLLAALHDCRPDLILSMEMFERDVQDILDAYLAGAVSEEEFLETSRPWGNYRPHYRPLVEYARDNGLAVLAANIPRPLARKVSKEGPEAIAGEEFAARFSTAPPGLYHDLFWDIMNPSGGEPDDELLQRFFAAQCYKDDTMAESIADTLSQAWGQGRQPLVVHVCGKFHSDFGEGTVSRLRDRLSELRIAVVTMESGDLQLEAAIQDPRGDVLWSVPAMEKEERPEQSHPPLTKDSEEEPAAEERP